MNEWLALLDINSLMLGLLAGLVLGLAALMLAVRGARRKGAEAEAARLLPELQEQESLLAERTAALADTQRELAVAETRLEEQKQHYLEQKASLEEGEKRLTEAFERLAGKVFDERSKRFTELSEKQLSGLLKPLAKDLESFRSKVEETAREDLWRVSDSLRIEARDDDFIVTGDHLPEAVELPDTIEMHAGNRFRWLGRHQDMVKIGGKRESLSDLNLQLTAIDGVDDGVIFMPDTGSRHPAALVVSKQLSPREVRRELGRHVDAVFLPRPIFIVDELPRQETGKIARKALLASYSDLLRDSSRKRP